MVYRLLFNKIINISSLKRVLHLLKIYNALEKNFYFIFIDLVLCLSYSIILPAIVYVHSRIV